MGRSVIKDEKFSAESVFPTWKTDAYVYENCSFINVLLYFGSTVKYVTFKNCKFSANSRLSFSLPDGIVRFEDCRFNGGTVFYGDIGEKGRVKFNKCKGLVEDRFDVLRNANQTLSEMGLYQTFKDRVLSTRKEEIVFKKIGIYDCSAGNTLVGFAIATLKIPKGAIRYGDRDGKCRCEEATVIDIEMHSIARIYYKLYADNPSFFKYGSVRDGGRTVYEVGKEIKPNYFDYVPNKCSYGIHYFYNLGIAEEYDFS